MSLFCLPFGIRENERSRKEYWVLPRKEFEYESNKRRIPFIYLSNIHGENLRIKKAIEELVDYVRTNGVKIEVKEETWKKLKFPLPCFIFARDLE